MIILKNYLGSGGMMVFFRCQDGGKHIGAKFKRLPNNVMPSVLMVFDNLLPNRWVQETIIPQMKSHLMPEIMYGEFLIWTGLWFIMSTTAFNDRSYFWSKHNI